MASSSSNRSEDREIPSNTQGKAHSLRTAILILILLSRAIAFKVLSISKHTYEDFKMAAPMKYAMRKRLVILSLILVVVDGAYHVGDKLDCAVDISSFEVLSALKRLQSGYSHLRVGTSYRLKISRRILGLLQNLYNSIVVSYISSCIPISSLLILLSGDVESNPGPGPKFPCGVCSRAVKLNQKGIQCDACDVWFHTKCDRLPDSEYMRLTNTEDPWYCSTCSLPPLSDSFFDTPDLNDSLNDTGNSCIDDSDASLPPYFCVPPTLSTSLLMSHLNIRSMLPKLDDVRLFLKQHKHGFVFGLSETWLSGNVTNMEVAIEGFNLYRRDRTNGSIGGGVAVYVSNNICSSRRRDLEEVNKTQFIVLHRKKRAKDVVDVKLELDGNPLTRSSEVKCLGILLDDKLTWKAQVHALRRKAYGGLSKLKRFHNVLPPLLKRNLYNALVLPHLDYCSVVWQECSVELRTMLERAQNFGMRLILSKPPRTPSDELRFILQWKTLEARREHRRLAYVRKCVNKRAPSDLVNLFRTNREVRGSSRSTRGNDKLYIHPINTEFRRKSFRHMGTIAWNRCLNK